MERMGGFYLFFLSSFHFFCKMVPKTLNFFVYNFTIYLFLALLGLCSCAAFSSCSKQGLLSSCSVRASHCGGFFCSRAEARVHGLQ